eukprot:Hpha_TRINITY_DN16150_c1_g6::TRINITY_DN16150_c1_g6_i3::g.3609::m.3609
MAQKRVIGPVDLGEDPASKVARVSAAAEGPRYTHAGLKPTPLQQQAYMQAASAYANFAEEANAKARQAKEVAGYYQRLTREGQRAITMMITGGPTEKPVQAEMEHMPFDVKVLVPESGAQDEMEVTWSTPEENDEAESVAFLGTDPNELGDYIKGDVNEAENIGEPRTHRILFRKLRTGTRYFFKVGDLKYGFTKVFKFKTAGQAAPAPPQESSGERRIDPADGRSYTKKEFLEAYHCLIQWNMAAPVMKPEDAILKIEDSKQLRIGPGIEGANRMVEKRYDPACGEGRLYTRDEFVEAYEGEEEWEKAPKQHEKRIDPADDKEYGWLEFRVVYKGRGQWDAARIPGEPTPPLVRMTGFGRAPPNGTAAFFAKRLLKFRAGCLSQVSQVKELPGAGEHELLLATGSTVASKALVEMINVARDFNTQSFPDLKAVEEPDTRGPSGDAGLSKDAANGGVDKPVAVPNGTAKEE